MMVGIKMNGDKAENLKKKKKCLSPSFIKCNIKERQCVSITKLVMFCPFLDCVLEVPIKQYKNIHTTLFH